MARGRAETRFDIQMVFADGMKYRRQSMKGAVMSIAELRRNLMEAVKFIDDVRALEQSVPAVGEAVGVREG